MAWSGLIGVALVSARLLHSLKHKFERFDWLGSKSTPLQRFSHFVQVHVTLRRVASNLSRVFHCYHASHTTLLMLLSCLSYCFRPFPITEFCLQSDPTKSKMSQRCLEAERGGHAMGLTSSLRWSTLDPGQPCFATRSSDCTSHTNFCRLSVRCTTPCSRWLGSVRLP